MNLYLISQDVNNSYDTYDSAVVAAKTELEARRTYPANSNSLLDYSWPKWEEEEAKPYGVWVKSHTQVKAEFIGIAAEGVEAGVILASFDAG